VQQGWDDGAINSLVVMTDGQNDDKAGVTIDQLIAQLKKSPTRQADFGDPDRHRHGVGQSEMEKSPTRSAAARSSHPTRPRSAKSS
jgi:hypothetical protein